ncbi:MAG TPA: hypothetical protein VFY87_21640 [Geminicoccaceae bacterium]|jgi:uncharacterized protein YjiS (DUF1127 family)|nr:hypothetical protein [Geminicoccaceae bacterium]
MTVRTEGVRTLRATVQGWLMLLRKFPNARDRRRRPTLGLEELSPHLLRDIGLTDGAWVALRRSGRLDA